MQRLKESPHHYHQHNAEHKDEVEALDVAELKLVGIILDVAHIKRVENYFDCNN